MEQVLPSNINYLDALPKALPSERRRKKFYPTNGPGFQQNSTIRILIEDTRAFLDPSNTTLQFTLDNANSGHTGCNDVGGGYSFIKNFRMVQAGNEILRVNNLSRLMNAIVVPSMAHDSIRGDDSIASSNNYANVTGGGAANNQPIAGGNSTGSDLSTGRFGDNLDIVNRTNAVVYNIPLVGGLFSQVGTSKLLPLPLLNKPIELYFDVSPVEDMLIWFGNVFNNNGPTIRDVSVIAELVEVPREVIGYIKELQMMHGGSLALQAQSYEHNQGLIPAGTTGNFVLNIPSRKKSIKAIYFVGASTNYATIMVPTNAAQSANLSYSGNMNISEYFLRAGSIVMPQPAVKGLGDDAVAGNNEFKKGEMFLELKKALGHMRYNHGTGCFASGNYGNLDGDNDNGAAAQQSPGERDGYEFCPYGLDLEAYQHEAISSGLDTQTLSLEMQLNLNLEAATAENMNVDIYSLHDIQYYINADGSLTFED